MKNIFALIIFLSSFFTLAKVPATDELYTFKPTDRGFVCERCSDAEMERMIKLKYPKIRHEPIDRDLRKNNYSNELEKIEKSSNLEYQIFNLYLFNSQKNDWVKYHIEYAPFDEGLVTFYRLNTNIKERNSFRLLKENLELKRNIINEYFTDS